jgi:hypothetical protein
MKTLWSRSLILSFTLVLITMGSACIWSIYEHTYLASATTPVDVRGFVPAGWVGPGQTLCLMARNQSPAGTGPVYGVVATTTTSTTVQHKGPTPGGSDWYGYTFPATTLPSWVWTGNNTQMYVSKTCSPYASGIADFSSRVFVNDAERDCFSRKLDAGVPWNWTGVCTDVSPNVTVGYRNMLYVHKP